ncbi:hypothetical protein BJ138DRAFT_1131157 [Hygrophoropsis aurantiaca]|uniref:Uncharacterized protein n=1 Tax=Hygrophoropsis aurantiaca TaxID=72124 RepID=A0ACB7ZS14_9AGAM|nr:hypothetical protein BJ138DRAFT_1131157 [Hygrophoropsis aurantiaca]
MGTEPRKNEGLPFEVVWVEFQDIASTLKSIGAEPTGPGSYTLPVINDPNTGVIVSDSFVIAEYLDKMYPEKQILPTDANILIELFEQYFRAVAYSALVKDILVKTHDIMNDSSKE